MFRMLFKQPVTLWWNYWAVFFWISLNLGNLIYTFNKRKDYDTSHIAKDFSFKEYSNFN